MYSIEQVDATARDLAPEISYHLDFSNASRHLVAVTMRFSTGQGTLPLVMPAWVPGSYKIRDFVTNQGNLDVRDGEGESIPYRWVTANRLEISPASEGTIVVTYSYYAAELSVRHSHVSRNHAFLNPGNLLMYIPGRTEEPVGISLSHPWSQVSTPLTPSRDGTRYLAENFDVLVDSPIEIGDHTVRTFDLQGAKHEVVITGDGNFDAGWVVDQCRRVVEQGFEFWGTVPYDRYIFFLQFLPGQYGGLEHARSQVSLFDSAAMRDTSKLRRFLALLTHEFFHTWNVKRIRPVELGPFDYEVENYSSMLWLAEGATSYFDDLLSYRTGFYSRKEYLRVLSDQHLNALLDVPGRLAMSIRDSSWLAWVKLYNQTPDSHNRFPSYYLKGGVLFLLLDLYIIRESDGKATLGDGMRALYSLYQERPDRGVTENEFLSIVSEVTGVDIASIFSDWLQGVDETEFEELFGAVGLLWKEKEPREQKVGPGILLPEKKNWWFGFATKEEGGRLLVARVSDESPIANAGIGVDDEILAVNGIRIESTDRFRAICDGLDSGDRLELLCASDQRIYTTEVIPLERPTMHLVKDANASESALRLQSVWLGSGPDGEDATSERD